MTIIWQESAATNMTKKLNEQQLALMMRVSSDVLKEALFRFAFLPCEFIQITLL